MLTMQIINVGQVRLRTCYELLDQPEKYTSHLDGARYVLPDQVPGLVFRVEGMHGKGSLQVTADGGSPKGFPKHGGVSVHF